MSLAFWGYWGPLAVYMASIFFLSSRSRPSTFDETPDFVLHAGAYFIMAVLAIRALARGLERPASTSALVGGVAMAIAYGASDELHQAFVPERVGSWLDLGFDAVGAVAAAALLSLFWHVRGERA